MLVVCQRRSMGTEAIVAILAAVTALVVGIINAWTSASRTEMESLRDTITTLQSTVTTLQSENKRLLGENADLRATVEKLECENNDLRNRLENLELKRRRAKT